MQERTSNGLSGAVFAPKSGRILIVSCIVAVLLIFLVLEDFRSATTLDVLVFDGEQRVGRIELRPLAADGSLRLAFVPEKHVSWDSLGLEWWQLAERQDRPGYPRIDPQSGGSGLPGARGEDEDPAYYSRSDFEIPEHRSRILADGRLWLLDHPTHDSGFNFESWLVQRTGPKSVRLLCGIEWGILRAPNGSLSYRNPAPLRRLSRFDWDAALRISGFGSGWRIETSYRITLP